MHKKRHFSFEVWDHNMIPGISLAKHKHMSRWVVWTVATTILLMIGLLCVDFPHYCAWYDVYHNEHILRMQVGRFEELVSKKHALKKEEQLLKDRHQKVQNRMRAKNHRFYIIACIKKHISNGITLVSCSVDKKQVVIVVTTVSLPELFLLYESIVSEKEFFASLDIVSITHHAEKALYTVMLKGGVVKI